jgi:outer membrane autotransporter protein
MKLFLRSIVFLIAITAFTPLASAQTLYWAGGTDASASVGSSPATTDNNFNTAGNWSTVPPNLVFTTGNQFVPGPGNIAIVQADLNNSTIEDDFFTGEPATPVVINQTSTGNTVNGLIITNYFGFETGGIVDFNNTSGQPLIIHGTNAGGGDFVVDGGVTFNTIGALAVTNGTIIIGEGALNANNTSTGSGTFNINSGTFTFDAAGTSTQMIVGYAPFGAAGGSNSTVTQGANGSSSTVTLGSSLIIGFNSSSGNTWNVTNGSTLQTGTVAASYFIALGSNGTDTEPSVDNGTGSSGALNISQNSTFNLGFAGSTILTDLELGTVTPDATGTVGGGSGTITQSGTSIVNIAGTNTFVEVGGYGTGVDDGGTGVYNLQGGTLNIGVNATDAVTFTLGADFGSSGTLTQTGGTLNVGNSAGTNHTTFTVGEFGTGIYNMNGGTANFSKALTLDADGTLNLYGGTLNITAGNLTGTGALNFGGGTLNFTNTTTAAFVDDFSGGNMVNGTVSTINASSGYITSVTFDNALGGSGSTGGLILEGTDGLNHGIMATAPTVFTFDGLNTYTGPTTIAGGSLTISAADIQDFSNSSSFTITSIANPVAFGGTSVGTLNLTLAANGLGYSGAIGGNGNLNISFTNPGDTFAIKNASSFTGAITLGANGVAGNLQVYNGTFGNIGDTDPTTHVSSGSSVTIGGTLPTINGSFVVPTSGTVTILNATYTGLTTVNQNFTLNANDLDGAATVGSALLPGGTLNVTGVGGIAGTVTDYGGLVNVTSAAGIGSVTSNTGTITTTGITGNVTSNAGIITSGLVGGSLTNSAGGTFISTTPINTTSVAGTVMNSGTIGSTSSLVAIVAAGTPNPNATFTSGSLTQTATGGLNIRVNGPTSDFYQINGTASFAAGSTLNVSGSTAIGSQSFTVIDATGGVSGTLATSDATALFSAVMYPSNDQSQAVSGDTVSITTTQLPITTYAITPNQIAVAQSLDSGGGNPIKTIFNQVTLGAATSFFPSALDQLSPENLQYARMIAFENSTFLVERMNGVDADLRAGYGGLDTSAISVVSPGFNNGLGHSLGSLLASDDPAFHSSAPNGVNYYPGGSSTSSPSSSSTSAPESTPTWNSSTQVISDSPNPYMANQNPASSETPRTSEFIGGDLILADLNQNQNTANSPSSKASYTAGDVTAGVGFKMTSHLAAGVLFDFNHTDATTDSYGSKTSVDSYSPGLFATYFDHGFYVNGLASFGYNTYSNQRDISFLNSEATSHPSGQQYVGDLDFGYDFHPAKNWVFGPTLGLTYTHLNIDSFTESGAAPADLTVDSQSADSLRSRLGGHVVFQTNTGDVLLQPNITAMWQHEYLDSSSGITSTFSDFSASPFTIQTAAPSRDSALIGVGLTATLSTSMALYLNYFADVGASDYFAQSVVGGLKARF